MHRSTPKAKPVLMATLSTGGALQRPTPRENQRRQAEAGAPAASRALWGYHPSPRLIAWATTNGSRMRGRTDASERTPAS